MILPGPVSLRLGICLTQPSQVTSAHSCEISIFNVSKSMPPPPHQPPYTIYSSPSILQPYILRPPFIIRLLDLLPKGNFFVLNDLYSKTTCNIRLSAISACNIRLYSKTTCNLYNFPGAISCLKIEGPLYRKQAVPVGLSYDVSLTCRITSAVSRHQHFSSLSIAPPPDVLNQHHLYSELSCISHIPHYISIFMTPALFITLNSPPPHV